MTEASNRMIVRPSDPLSGVTISKLCGVGYVKLTKLGPTEPLPDPPQEDPVGRWAWTQASTWSGVSEVTYQAVDVA